MQQRVYECRMNSVDELKQCLIEVCNSLQHYWLVVSDIAIFVLKTDVKLQLTN